jgi:hypothetical protein
MRGLTRDQDLAAQDAELMAAGCAKVFKEKAAHFGGTGKTGSNLEGICRRDAPKLVPKHTSRKGAHPVGALTRWGIEPAAGGRDARTHPTRNFGPAGTFVSA